MSMRAGNVWAIVSVAAICLCAAFAGCGGGASSSTGAATEGKGAEPSARFLKPHSKERKLVTFGHEAPVEEREEAGAVVAASLKARAAGDFAAQCATLSRQVILKLPEAKGPSDCAAALKKVAEPLSSTKEFRKDTLAGAIAAMRVEGDRGYTLFHGNDGNDYLVPVKREAGAWKVDSLANTEI